MRLLQPDADWIATSAKVVACEYRYASFADLGREDGLDHSKYQILFSYSAGGEHYEGYFFKHEPIEEATLLPLLYNPSKPTENNLSLFPEKKSHLLLKWTVGIAIATLVIFLSEHFGLDTE